MMESKTLTALRDAKANYDSAVKANMNVAAKKQVLVNILVSHAGELIETALDAENLLQKNIEDRREIAKLKKQIEEMTVGESDIAESEKTSSKRKNG